MGTHAYYIIKIIHLFLEQKAAHLLPMIKDSGSVSSGFLSGNVAHPVCTCHLACLVLTLGLRCKVWYKDADTLATAVVESNEFSVLSQCLLSSPASPELHRYLASRIISQILHSSWYKQGLNLFTGLLGHEWRVKSNQFVLQLELG